MSTRGEYEATALDLIVLSCVAQQTRAVLVDDIERRVRRRRRRGGVECELELGAEMVDELF